MYPVGQNLDPIISTQSSGQKLKAGHTNLYIVAFGSNNERGFYQAVALLFQRTVVNLNRIFENRCFMNSLRL